MKTRFFCILLCAMLMAVGTVAVATSADDTTADPADAATVKITGLDNDAVVKILKNGNAKNKNIEEYVWFEICKPLGLNRNLILHSTTVMECRNLDYSSGMKNMLSGDGRTLTKNSFFEMSMDFTLTLTVKGDGYDLLDHNDQYCGEGIAHLLKIFGEKRTHEGETIRIEGSFSTTICDKHTQDDLFENAAGLKFPKTHIYTSNTSESYDVSVTVDGKRIFDDEFHEKMSQNEIVRYEIVNGDERSHDNDRWQMSSGRTSTMMKSNGVKTFDGTPYGYGSGQPSGTESFESVMIQGPKNADTEMNVHFYALPIVNEAYGDDNTIMETVIWHGGTATHDLNEFDRAYDDVKNGFVDNGTDTPWWMLIVIVAVMAVIAGLLYRLLARRTE